METKLGKNGEKLLEYVKWLHDRIIALRKDESYQPVLHIDVYGTMGIAFDNDLEKIADYMKTLCDAAAPFHLRIEGPVDVATARSRWKLCGISPPSATRRTSRGDRGRRVVQHSGGHHLLRRQQGRPYDPDQDPRPGRHERHREAVLYCKKKGIGAYQGGTCNETDRSAQVCVQVAMATQPDQILAKPAWVWTKAT